MGRPEEIALVEGSHTGRFLKSVLPRVSGGSSRASRSAAAVANGR
jgi:hypothetical protein